MPDFRIFKSQREHRHEPLKESRDRLKRWKPLQPPMITKPAKLGHQYPLHTFNAMVHPIMVRYAWAMNPSRRNLLYNREGVPASPFRTDDEKTNSLTRLIRMPPQ